MADDPTRNGYSFEDASFDERWGSRIAQAYDSLEPSAEAQERMFAAIMAAQRQAGASRADGMAPGAQQQSAFPTGNVVPFERADGARGNAVREYAGSENAARGNVVDGSFANANAARTVKRKRSPLRIALPIAASILIVAGAGILAVNALGFGKSYDAAPMASEAAYEEAVEAAGAEAPEAATNDMDAGAVPQDSEELAYEADMYDEAPATESAAADADVAAEESAEAEKAATSEDATPAPPMETYVELSDGRTIKLAEHDGAYEPADEQFIGSVIETTTATSRFMGHEGATVTVYEYADGFFAVQFEDDPAYYLAIRQ